MTKMRRVSVLVLFALISGLSVNAAAPASAAELKTQYSYYDHCNKKSWISYPTNYHYEYSYSNRAGYYQYYRALQVIPTGPWSNPIVNTWWRVVKCGEGA
jgi:hypothetical protein